MVKKEYRVIVLQAGLDESVTLGIVPVFAPRSEEAERQPNPAKILVGPALESEDAKVMREMVSVGIAEVERRVRQFNQPPATCTPTGLIPLNLTKEEYEQLGKPTPNEIITLTLERASIGSEAAQQETG